MLQHCVSELLRTDGRDELIRRWSPQGEALRPRGIPVEQVVLGRTDAVQWLPRADPDHRVRTGPEVGQRVSRDVLDLDPVHPGKVVRCDLLMHAIQNVQRVRRRILGEHRKQIQVAAVGVEVALDV